MDFKFIGGSMGAVVGERIARAIDFCRDERIPLMVISKTGGANDGICFQSYADGQNIG